MNNSNFSESVLKNMYNQDDLINKANEFLSQFEGQETFSRSDMLNAFYQGSMHQSESFSPIGYKLVPIKMTEEMFEALADSPWIVESTTTVHDNVVKTVRKEFRDQRYVEDGWNAILKSVPESKEAIEQKKQLVVMRALETGQWQICRHLPSTYLTDEANDESKWSVRRQEAPFCDRDGKRQWEGPTAFDAIVKAKMALGV